MAGSSSRLFRRRGQAAAWSPSFIRARPSSKSFWACEALSFSGWARAGRGVIPRVTDKISATASGARDGLIVRVLLPFAFVSKDVLGCLRRRRGDRRLRALHGADNGSRRGERRRGAGG